MRSAAAGLMVFAGNVLAHPGHGAVEGHMHAWGIEHGILLFVVVAFLAYAARK